MKIKLRGDARTPLWLEVHLDTRDLWVGVFVDTNAVYVCPVPCLVLRFRRGPRVQDPTGEVAAIRMHKLLSEEGLL